MSELKAFDVIINDDYKTKCYMKADADKVIADLEERHKKEVEQLLIEIAELKEKFKNSRNSRKYWMKEYLIEYEETRHNKYKRCLAMARWCHNQREIYERDSYNWELEPAAVDSLRNKANIMRKWRKRWQKLAEKFKEAK